MMFTFALTAAFIAPLFAATILDEEEKSDPDIVRRPSAGKHEGCSVPVKGATPVEIISVSERPSASDYAQCAVFQAAGG